MTLTDSGAPGEPRPHARRTPVGRVVLVVLGAILVLLSLAIGAVGAALTWAHTTQRDASGYFTTDEGRFETLSYAISSEEVDLGARPGGGERRFDLGDLATVRIRVDSPDDTELFVGVGPQDEVDAYLAGVAHAVIDDIDFDPFAVTYRFRPGGEPEQSPEEAGFWVATAQGSGRQTLEWEIESGQWAVVLMNADGSEGVGASLSVGVKADWVLPVGVALLVGAAVLLLGGSAMLAVGAVGLARRGDLTPGAAVASPGDHQARAHPLRLDASLDEPLSRWLWLVKPILLIPHFVVLVVLWAVFVVLTIVAGISILFTGRYPRSIFGFNVGVLRWSWRVGYYSFSAFGTDRYPPFSLGPEPDYPARLDVAYPERLSRGLVLVKSWLLALPHLVILGVIGGGLFFGWDGDRAGGPGLIPWLALIAAVGLLFLARYPSGIFDFVMGLNRWAYRVIVYAALMTDDYPPFRLDQGGDEPAVVPDRAGP